MHEDELRAELHAIAEREPAPAGDARGALHRARVRLARRWAGVSTVALLAIVAVVSVLASGGDGRRGVVVASSTTTTPRPSVPASADKVIFTTPQEGWVCGLGQLLHTADGGAHWQSLDLGARDEVDCAAAEHNAWVVHTPFGSSPQLSLAQGGSDLAGPVDLPIDTPIAQVTFVDAQHGWILAYGSAHDSASLHGRLYRSTEGGLRFTQVLTIAPNRMVAFRDQNEGWGLDDEGVLHTTDGGATWTGLNVPVPNGVQGLSLSFDRIAVRGSTIVVQGQLAGGNFGTLFFDVSTDGGQSWIQRPGPSQSFGTTDTLVLSVVDAQHWRVASPGRSELWVTDDGGTTWSARDLPGSVRSLSFPTADDGWWVSDGALLHTTDAGESWHRVDTTPSPVWSSGLAVVPGGCPSAPVVATTIDATARAAAQQAALDYLRTRRGWLDVQVVASYDIGRGEQPSSYAPVFDTNVPKDCGQAVADASFGFDIVNPAINQDSSRITALAVGHFADGWKVWGFYR